jgi:hypothetical protein
MPTWCQRDLRCYNPFGGLCSVATAPQTINCDAEDRRTSDWQPWSVVIANVRTAQIVSAAAVINSLIPTV